MHRLVLLLLTLAAIASDPRLATPAELRVTSSDELAAALRQPAPGTTILVAPGKYRGGLSASKLAGNREQPIVIAGSDPKNPPLIEGGPSGLHLSSPAHVELRDLVFVGASGNGINIDDSGSTDTPAHHVVLRRIAVRDVGPRGNRDGIKLSGLRDFQIQSCRVERWGSGGSAIDMVGCASGVVNDCTFAEAGGEMANGVQTKGGSSDIVIQRCRFENAGGRAVNAGGSTGSDYFRPRDATYEARDITVEDCQFIGGASAIAFVGVDGALVRHNTIYRPRRWAIRILQENNDPRLVASRNGQFRNNVVAFRVGELRNVVNIGANTAPQTFTFADNVWCCLDRPADTRRLVELPVAESGGQYDVNLDFADPDRGDLRITGNPLDAGVRPPAASQ